MRYLIVLAAILFTHAGTANAAGSSVVVTIKPLHSLVAAVMEGDENQPVLLVDGKASMHDFSLKPSQVKALQNAAVVFYLDEHFEMFIDKTLDSLPKTVRRAPLGAVAGLARLPVRSGGDFEADEHAHDEGKTSPKPFDMHLWMSPLNAKVLLMEITRQLAITFPEKRERYFSNARTLSSRIDALDRDIDLRMSRLASKSFIAFHDAYQYFESRYSLNAVGSMTLHAEHGIGAKRISDLREKITKLGVRCVFREPQFDGKIVDNLLAGTKAKSAMLDPEGALLAPGPELYFQLIEGVAKGMETCLAS